MTYKLFIDDEREPIGDDWVICRTSEEARRVILSRGLPVFVSFDHDLGGTDTSMVFLHWLIDYMLDNNLTFPPEFSYGVHSQNPVGVKNIRGLLDSFIRVCLV